MCTCASCKYTDGYAAKGFAAWPRGEPAGRKSASDYAAHWRHCTTWQPSKGATREFPGAVPTSPLRYSPPAQRDPGADRTYPTHADTPEGWSGTAAYVEAFIAANNYAKEPSPARAEPGRPRTPGKAHENLPAPDRQREPARIYAMPKKSTEPREPSRGRGRPAMPGRRVVIKLEEEQIKRAAKLGGGNVAAGIRKALSA